MTKAKLFLFLTLALLFYGCMTKSNLVIEQPVEHPQILQLVEISKVDITILELYVVQPETVIVHARNYNNEICEMVVLSKIKKAVESYIKDNYPEREDEHVKDIAHYLTELCNEEEVNIELMLAIMEIESQFNPFATNKRSKAAGLMQVMPFWAKDFNLSNKKKLYDIETNISCGIKIYKIFYALENGNTKRALYRYVGGSRSYPKKVLDVSRIFNKYFLEIDS
jgi:hypothetical protein